MKNRRDLVSEPTPTAPTAASGAITALSTPHDLLAAVPFLLGYHPEESLVVISLHHGVVGMAMRIDLPEPELSDDTGVAKQAAHLAHYLGRDGADGAIVVGYLPTSVDFSTTLLNPYVAAITELSIPISDVIEVRAGHFRSRTCEDDSCCPPGGSPISLLSDTRVASEQVVAGHPMPFANLQELRESIAAITPHPESLLALSTLPQIKYQEWNETQILDAEQEGARAIDTLCERYSEMGIAQAPELVALVLTRLRDLRVRDYAMGISTPENFEALWSMWRWLLRIAPTGYVAPVAVIFALLTYERGEGARAQRALDRAFADEPGYPMAKLLRRTFAAGWSPESFTQMREELHPKICAALFS